MSGFRGVVHSGIALDDGRLVLAVGHPHPDNNFGGGPGPAREWNQPYDPDAYAALVDRDAGDPDDATFELREVRHVAIGGVAKRGRRTWRLVEVVDDGTIETMQMLDRDVLGLLISYGGGASCVVRLPLAAKHGDVLAYRDVPRTWVEPRACFLGDDVILAGSESFATGAPSQIGICARDGDTMRWQASLGIVPGRVLAVHARTAGGDRVIYAGGAAIWRHDAGTWRSLHDPMPGTVVFLDVLPSGELVAGTADGSVIVGHDERCRAIGRVGPICSVAQLDGVLYVSDAEARVSPPRRRLRGVLSIPATRRPETGPTRGG